MNKFKSLILIGTASLLAIGGFSTSPASAESIRDARIRHQQELRHQQLVRQQELRHQQLIRRQQEARRQQELRRQIALRRLREAHHEHR